MIAVPFPSPFDLSARLVASCGKCASEGARDGRHELRRAPEGDGNGRQEARREKKSENAGPLTCDSFWRADVDRVSIAERFFNGVLHTYLLGVRNRDILLAARAAPLGMEGGDQAACM